MRLEERKKKKRKKEKFTFGRCGCCKKKKNVNPIN